MHLPERGDRVRCTDTGETVEVVRVIGDTGPTGGLLVEVRPVSARRSARSRLDLVRTVPITSIERLH